MAPSATVLNPFAPHSASLAEPRRRRVMGSLVEREPPVNELVEELK
jgi:hypothetical protein